MSTPRKTSTDWHAQGRKSRAEGKAFEKRISEALDYYAEYRVAYIEKTPEPMKVLRSMGRGQFLACFEKKAQPDYQGTAGGGISVMFEAKFTDKDRITQDYVSDGQTKYLRRHSSRGAKCYVIVGFSNGKAYRIPFAVWDNMKRIYGRKYVTPADLEQYEIVERNGILLVLHRTKGEHSHD